MIFQLYKCSELYFPRKRKRLRRHHLSIFNMLNPASIKDNNKIRMTYYLLQMTEVRHPGGTKVMCYVLCHIRFPSEKSHPLCVHSVRFQIIRFSENYA